MEMNINQPEFKHFTALQLVLCTLPKHHFQFTKVGIKTILLNGIVVKILTARFPGPSSKSQDCHNRTASGSLLDFSGLLCLHHLKGGEIAKD